jgi:hypothetical protein
MSIVEAVQRLFTIPQRRSRVTDYVNELFAIQGEIDDITAKLGDPVAPANIDELVQRRATLQEKLKIIAGRKAKAENDQYRAKLEERREAFHRDLAEPMEWLRANLPRVQYELIRMQEMEARMDEDGTGRQWTEITNGFPSGAPARIQAAIGREVRGTDWEELYTPPSLLKHLAAGREYAKRRAEEQAAQQAARQAEFDAALAEFEAGRGPDPRLHTFRVRAG